MVHLGRRESSLAPQVWVVWGAWGVWELWGSGRAGGLVRVVAIPLGWFQFSYVQVGAKAPKKS